MLLGTSFTLVSAVPPSYHAKVAPASEEPQQAKTRMRIPKGFHLDLWAAEPQLANPVAFCFDHQGRVYVAETFRLHQGVSDIRGHMNWLDDDLSCRTVEDRLAMMRKYLGRRFADYGVHHERIRLLEDSKGQGKCDKSTVFADGFNRPEAGIAAGVLARGKEVWYACIPDLIRFCDGQREVLHTGYGVRVGFIGHDLHGLTFGPDGKIYFSIGDRGLNVKAGNRHLEHPDTGSVLRCNPDGSELEVFATGLRNPQELCFDNYGNLFTGDNNSDGGDRARWVYLLEGGDSSWRIGYQFETSMSNRGPWNAEKLWHPPHPGQPAWIVPPLANLGDGPSGLTYDPGVGLPERYREHFFLADFRGAANNSGIRSFAVKPRGAGFELTDSHEFLWGVLATDVDFGPDGAMYVSDWVHGWGLTGKGRLWKLTHRAADPKQLAEIKQLLAEGMSKKSIQEIAKLLEHLDRRVRLEAQFSLAERGTAALSAFEEALKSKQLLARLHAIWGLGQIGRRESRAFAAIHSMLKDTDPEVRAQAAKVLGDGKHQASATALIDRLKDESPRVRYFAALALGKLGYASALLPLTEMLRENADRDPFLRHGGVMGLAGCGQAQALRKRSSDSSPAVRRAALLALRRQGSGEIAVFVQDRDSEIVTEAARAIHDVPIESAWPALEELLHRPQLNDSIGYRALNAHFRSGSAKNAEAVAAFAVRSDESERLRLEAVRMLREWDKPGIRDRVLGTARPVLPREQQGLSRPALVKYADKLLQGFPRLRQETAQTIASFQLASAAPTIFRLATDAAQPAEVRVEMLRTLGRLRDSRLLEAVRMALGDRSPQLRTEARRQLLAVDPDEAMKAIEQTLEKGTVAEKQGGFEALGRVQSDKARTLLARWLDQLLADKVDPAVRLELLEATERHPQLKERVQAYESARDKSGPLGKWRDTLYGGDREAGRRIFVNKSEVSCLRCHKAAGEGTGEVGPELTGIGSKQSREYLLESIVFPNKQIAKGFETVDVVLDSGQVRSGIVKGETDKVLRLMDADGKLHGFLCNKLKNAVLVSRRCQKMLSNIFLAASYAI